MKAYRGSIVTIPLIPNLSTRWTWVASHFPTAGWAPKSIWTFCRTDVSVSRTGVWTPDRPALGESLCRSNYLGACDRRSAVFEIPQAATPGKKKTLIPLVFVYLFSHLLSSVYQLKVYLLALRPNGPWHVTDFKVTNFEQPLYEPFLTLYAPN
jgi:hypothetical protein